MYRLNVASTTANLLKIKTAGSTCLASTRSYEGSRGFVSSVNAGLSGMKINPTRLHETLHKTCKWGAAHRYGKGETETGMARLTLSDDDKKVRDWFVQETELLGCVTTVDEMGNIFAKRKGLSGGDAPMTAMGSHLDTQPRGGRYDGILGVMAAIEVLRTMKDNNYRTKFDVGIVDWTNEEGARFPMSMCASGVWAGLTPIEEAWSLHSISEPSLTMRSELERIKFLGKTKCSSDAYQLGAHFELHIEQGPILQNSAKRIGVVLGAQAYRWLTITINGQDAHTGTTPFSARRDPLLAAAKMIAASSSIAEGKGALASTGIIKVPENSSTNTIPSSVVFTLDIRHPDDLVVDQVQRLCFDRFSEIAKKNGKGVDFSWKEGTRSNATKFNVATVKSVKEAATSLVGEDGWMDITSGAGHDSVYTSKVCPSAMIFVPCRDGVSHNPMEYCSPEDCALGAQMLLESVHAYDQRRSP